MDYKLNLWILNSIYGFWIQFMDSEFNILKFCQFKDSRIWVEKSYGNMSV